RSFGETQQESAQVVVRGEEVSLEEHAEVSGGDLCLVAERKRSGPQGEGFRRGLAGDGAEYGFRLAHLRSSQVLDRHRSLEPARGQDAFGTEQAVGHAS